MEQVQELLNILKETPEMALWGITIYFLFILLKLASWVYAIKVVAQQFIKRYFNYRDKSLNNSRAAQITEMFENDKISSVSYNSLIKLLSSVKNNSNYIHESDLERAIKAVNDSKKTK